MRRLLREGRRVQKPRLHDQSCGRLELDDLRFLGGCAAGIEPANGAAFGKLAIGGQPVVPATALGRDKCAPRDLDRRVQPDLFGSARHEASRATVCTSLTPSSFSIRRESCASESISTVVETTAVLSSYTWTSSDDMLTRFSATTVAMSRSNPCRSQASILIATG